MTNDFTTEQDKLFNDFVAINNLYVRGVDIGKLKAYIHSRDLALEADVRKEYEDKIKKLLPTVEAREDESKTSFQVRWKSGEDYADTMYIDKDISTMRVIDIVLKTVKSAQEHFVLALLNP